jgi:hypothetical protein
MLTPALDHLLYFKFVGSAKKVSKLINRPVVSLLGTRMGGTSTEVSTQCIYNPSMVVCNNRLFFSFLGFNGCIVGRAGTAEDAK